MRQTTRQDATTRVSVSYAINPPIMVQYSAEHHQQQQFPSRPVCQLLGSNGPIHALTYSHSPSTYILTGSSDRSIRLYNPSALTTSSSPSCPPTGKLIQTFTAHSHSVLSLSISQSNAQFASSGGDRTVHLWDVSTSQVIRRFGSSSTTHSHTGRVNSVTFAGADDSLLISGGLDCTVRIWDTKSSSSGSQKPVQVLSEARDSVTSLAVHGAEVITGSVDGRVRTYDVRAGRCVTDVFPASVTSLCLSRDGKTLLVGTLDSKLRLMDRRDGTCLKTYGDEGYANKELRVQSCMGGRERWVVSGDEEPDGGNGGDNNGEGRVWAWDLMTGKVVKTLGVPWGPGPESRRVIVGRDGKERERKNVVSCIAWQDGGFGSQFCVGGTSGVVNVFGTE